VISKHFYYRNEISLGPTGIWMSLLFFNIPILLHLPFNISTKTNDVSAHYIRQSLMRGLVKKAFHDKYNVHYASRYSVADPFFLFAL
jgi:hypothetical protein